MLLINQYIMKKVLLIICAIGIIPITSFGQTNSDSCIDASNATPITAAGTFAIDAINGDAPTLICNDMVGTGSNGEWYRYAPTDNYFVTVTSDLPANNNMDTRVLIYTGSCGSLICLGGNDDVGGGNNKSTITFEVQTGQIYYIAWDNTWGATTFDFELSETIVPPLVSFTTATISAPGLDRGVVDMDGDFLDDIVSVSSATLTINYQQNNGLFTKVSYPITSAFCGSNYSASWSMAAGDYDRNGYNDLVYGNSSGTQVVKANNSGNGYSVAYRSDSVFTQRTNFVDLNNDGNLDVFICDDTAPNEYFINKGIEDYDVVIDCIPGESATGSVTLISGSSGDIDGITIDGEEIMNSAEAFDTNLDTTAQNVASNITAFDSSPNYTATALNNIITITAVNSGTSFNGLVVSTTSSSIGFSQENMSGGINESNDTEIQSTTVLELWEGDDSNAPITGGLGVYPSGGNYGSVWVDYDNDGDSDLFIAKCGGEENRRKNQLFRNNGNLSFTDVSVASNMDDALSTWSSAWGDYDSDGDMDCFVGSSLSGEPHKLMQNNNGIFADITASSGLDVFSDKGHENQPFDFNNDGYIDIFSNGNILVNDGDGTFTVYSSGIPQEGAVGDLNNDGFLDVFASQIYYNDGNSNNWLKVGLIGTNSNINAIGARVEVSSPSFNNSSSKKAQIRDVRSAQGFSYMSTLNTHFGLGTDSSVNTVTIYWPSGTIDIIVNPNINETLMVTEGETLSVESTITTDLILYPNPTKRMLNLKTTFSFENAVYSVFDMTGRRVLNDKFNSNDIDVSALSTGNYILRVIDNGVIKTQKFIKQ
jgi:3'-phosphoadenosine 5'-phosphosulfate sulfotransferase